MQLFETKLIWNILAYLPLSEIGKICSSLTSANYQRLCKDDCLWQQLLIRDYAIHANENSLNLYQQYTQLYRDYGVFGPILDQEKYNLSVKDLYLKFSSDPLYNSAEFRNIYAIMSEYVPKIEFYDDFRQITITPTILRKPYTPFVQTNFQFDLVLPDKYEVLIEKLQKLGYQASTVYGGMFGSPPLYMTLSGRMDQNHITFKIPVLDPAMTRDYSEAIKRIRGY